MQVWYEKIAILEQYPGSVSITLSAFRLSDFFPIYIYMYAELAQSVHSASIRFERLVGGRDV